MKAEPLPCKDAHLLPQKLLINLPALEQIPDLRFERQERIFALPIRPAAHLRTVGLHPFAQSRQPFRLLSGQSFEQSRASEEVDRHAALEAPRPRFGKPFVIEQTEI